MPCRLIALTVAVLLAWTSACSADLIIPASHRGWYQGTGFNDPNNLNYITGIYSVTGQDSHYRDFFVFDLSAVMTPIVTAQLDLRNPTFGYTHEHPTDTLGIFDVSTNIDTLNAGAGGTAAYNDLGSGTQFGSVTVDDSINFPPTSAGYPVLVSLNSAGVAALNDARGGRIAFGGAITTLTGNELDENIFSRSNATFATNLILQTSVIAEPSSLVLLGPGAAAVLAFGWARRRQTRARLARHC
jgi:hypothetical protein